MRDLVNIPAVQIMIGTLPILAAIVWNLIEVRTLRDEIRDLRSRVDALAVKIGELAERVSKIEGKIEGHHVVLES